MSPIIQLELLVLKLRFVLVKVNSQTCMKYCSANPANRL